MDVRIYVITHAKKLTLELPEIYIPLQVGKEGKEDLGYIGDNSGDNISEKNPDYCELTGLYWIYKNVKCEITGICHYRRFFEANNVILMKEDIENILNEYDLIAFQNYRQDQTMFSYFSKEKAEDMMIIRKIIRERHKEYLDSFDWNITNHSIFLANMMITRKELFDAYCNWLFDILFEAEKKIDLSRYDYPTRLFGYLSEWLQGVWITMQPIKVKQIPIILYN